MSDLVERLRQSADVWGPDDVGRVYAEAADRIEALEAEVAALRKDAERYRHIRDTRDRIMLGSFPAVEVPRDWLANEATADTDDAAIDAAIQQHAAGRGEG